jgi:hypothetical protein
MNYTKGEWKITKLSEPVGRYPRYYVEAPCNNAVAIIDVRNDNAQEDARLISAAPDMYEALKVVAGWFVEVKAYIPHHGATLGQINNALAKAEGK